MKIVLIVGNGFDIGLGLKTDYGSFIREYADLSQPHDPTTIEYALKREISKDPLSWADAEMAFARLDFSKILSGCASFDRAFFQLSASFRSSLCDYLKNQERRFKSDKVDCELQSKFLEQVVSSYLDGMKPEDRRQEVENLAGNQNEIRCINLNYTKTIDRLFDWVGMPKEVEVATGRMAKFAFRSVYHVHGTLEGNDSIFGVSSDKDIVNEQARRVCQNVGIFIKGREAKEGGNDYDDAVHAMFEADRIVFFGTSLGASDVAWWDRVMYRLTADERVLVGMFMYSPNPTEIQNKLDWMHLQYEGRDLLRQSFSCANDDIEMQSVIPALDRVLVMRQTPYRNMIGGTNCGDPWDLGRLSGLLVK